MVYQGYYSDYVLGFYTLIICTYVDNNVDNTTISPDDGYSGICRSFSFDVRWNTNRSLEVT